MPDEAARRMLAQALARLSPVQRQATLLRLREAVEIEDIAARLDLSPDAVQASLAFGLAQLRMALSDAPMERERDDWLQRCRALLLALPAPAMRVPVADSVSGSDQGSTPSRPAGAGLWLRLLVACGVLALVAGVFIWQAWRPVPLPATPVADIAPQRMPAPNAPEAPLTAPDFLLVLLQQQHPGVLEDLAFYVWLAEQDALP